MTLVLVHGVPETPAVWDPLRAHLQRTDVVTPQLPGFGCPLPAGFEPTKEDPFQSAGRSRQVAERAGASTADLEGLGHWWMLQDPARVAPLITGILGGAGVTLAGLTAPAIAFLSLAGVSALVDWWAVFPEPVRERVEYVAKPATLLALLVAAAVLRTPAGEGSVRAWFLPALACCLAGDVLLMLPGERRAAFAGGLAAFLAGHVCFLVGLSLGGATLGAALVAAAVLVILAAAPVVAVLRGVARRLGPAMVGPVVLYVAALLAMAAAAWSAALAHHPGGAGPLLAVGGSLFVVSDTLLSLDRFVRRLPRGTLAVHTTYHLAVAALVLALA